MQYFSLLLKMENHSLQSFILFYMEFYRSACSDAGEWSCSALLDSVLADYNSSAAVFKNATL